MSARVTLKALTCAQMLGLVFGLALTLDPGEAPAQSELSLSDVLSPRGLDGLITPDRLPVPEDAFLLEGRSVWEGTCMKCHGGNKATGAPKITATKKWQPRIAQGLPTLFEHATEGFVGKTYAEMPPRGANPNLSDAEIEKAVTFMVWASGGEADVITYIKQTQE